jgi:renalase
MTTDVLIIGAGLAGLTAARVVREAGLTLHIVDNGRSVGGRLATTPIQSGIADDGAQFFTARTDEFQAAVDAWQKSGLVRVWGYGWSDGSTKRTREDGHARYVAEGGMNQLAHHLAQGIDPISLNVEVEFVERVDDVWRVTDKAGKSYTGKALLLTPPVPQTLALLTHSHVPLTPTDQDVLERIEYGPCLCGMFVVEGEVNLPEPGAIQDFDKPVYWIADNQRKGISAQRIITAHVEARYSRVHYDAPDAESLAFIREAIQHYLADDARIVEEQLKKWRYSVPLTTHPLDYYVAEHLPLYLAGDAFGGRGRVEGAYMSGLAAGKELVAALKPAAE